MGISADVAILPWHFGRFSAGDSIIVDRGFSTQKLLLGGAKIRFGRGCFQKNVIHICNGWISHF